MGPLSEAAPIDVLEAAHDGRKGRWLLRDGVPGSARGDAGRSALPAIFNVLVDAVVRNWVTVLIAGAEEQGEHGQEGRHQAALFYRDDGTVASSGPR